MIYHDNPLDGIDGMAFGLYLDRPFSTHVLVDIEHQVDARSPADSWTPLLAVAGLSRFWRCSMIL